MLKTKEEKLQEVIQAARDGLSRFDNMDCGDNSCMYATKKTGMRTNGGCHCYDRPNFHLPVMRLVLGLRKALKELDE